MTTEKYPRNGGLNRNVDGMVAWMLAGCVGLLLFVASGRAAISPWVDLTTDNLAHFTVNQTTGRMLIKNEKYNSTSFYLSDDGGVVWKQTGQEILGFNSLFSSASGADFAGTMNGLFRLGKNEQCLAASGPGGYIKLCGRIPDGTVMVCLQLVLVDSQLQIYRNCAPPQRGWGVELEPAQWPMYPCRGLSRDWRSRMPTRLICPATWLDWARCSRSNHGWRRDLHGRGRVKDCRVRAESICWSTDWPPAGSIVDRQLQSADGVYRSKDGGATWGQFNTGLPAGRVELSLCTQAPDGTLYAAAEGPYTGDSRPTTLGRPST